MISKYSQLNQRGNPLSTGLLYALYLLPPVFCFSRINVWIDGQVPTDMKGKIEIDLSRFVPYLVDDLHRLFQDSLTSALATQNLTVPEWRVLVCLNQKGACALNEIVEFTCLPQSTLSRTVSGLHAKRMVLRNKSQDDSRVSKITLSAAGSKRLERAIAACEMACRSRISHLSEKEYGDWITIMQKVLFVRLPR